MSESIESEALIDTEAGVVAEIARAAAGPQPFELDPAAAKAYMVRTRNAHGGDVIALMDSEYLAAQPRRIKGEARFTEADSFERYVNDFKGWTRIYASISVGQIVAVLNDDGTADADEPANWRDHRASLALERTPEWNRWREQDGRMGSQVNFAEHLELNLQDIIDPPAADLVEVARSFTASSEIAFRSAHDLATGETQFAYDEQVTTTAGTKSIAVPKVFTLRIMLFRGTVPVDVTARLRYRLHGSDLRIGYMLDLPDQAEEHIVAETLVSIEEATGIKPLMGIPAAQR